MERFHFYSHWISFLYLEQSIPLPSSPLSTSQQITHQAPPPQVQSHSNAQNLEFAQYANRVGIPSPGGDINVLGGSNLNDPINQNGVHYIENTGGLFSKLCYSFSDPVHQDGGYYIE